MIGMSFHIGRFVVLTSQNDYNTDGKMTRQHKRTNKNIEGI